MVLWKPNLSVNKTGIISQPPDSENLYAIDAYGKAPAMSPGPSPSSDTLFQGPERDPQSPTSALAQQRLQEHHPLNLARDDGDSTTSTRARGEKAARRSRAFPDRLAPENERKESRTATWLRNRWNRTLNLSKERGAQTAVHSSGPAKLSDTARSAKKPQVVYPNSPIHGDKEHPPFQPGRESNGEKDDHILPNDRYMSSMRWFLDSNAVFEWPPDAGPSSGNHCHLEALDSIPFVWTKCLSDKTTSIHEYRCDPRDPRYRFRRFFVVKTIHKSHYNERVA